MIGLKKILTTGMRGGIFSHNFIQPGYMSRTAPISLIIFIAVLCVPVLCLSDHSFFPIYNVTHLSTTKGDVYNFYSPGVNYTFNGRRQFGFFSSVSILFPRRSSQNGESYKNSDYYKRKIGADLMMGAGMKFKTSERLSLVPSFGVHLNGIRLRGKELYKDFYNLSFGVGLNLQARYGISRRMDGTAFVSASWDFVDLIHQENKLQNGFVLTLGLGLTF
jgi:hypothetical protein